MIVVMNMVIDCGGDWLITIAVTIMVIDCGDIVVMIIVIDFGKYNEEVETIDNGTFKSLSGSEFDWFSISQS